MIALPCKTTSNADISRALKNYANYAKPDSRDLPLLSELGSTIDKARGDMRKVTVFVGEATMNIYEVYMSYVNQMLKCLPLSEKDPMSLQTSWVEIAGRKSCESYNFQLEKACVLLNTVCLRSQAAVKAVEAGYSMTSVTAALTELRTAAGICQYIRLSVSPVLQHSRVELTWDLSDDGLEALEQLLLAQAQVMVFQKAKLSMSTYEIMARVILGAHEQFLRAGDKLKAVGASKDILDQVNYHCDFSKVLSYIYRAKFCMENLDQTLTGCGESITLMKVAASLIDSFNMKYPKKLLESNRPSIIEAQAMVQELYKNALDQNRIYTNFVPAEKDLGAFESRSPAVSIVYDLREPVSNVFDKFVGESVQRALTRYSREYVEPRLSEYRKLWEVADAEYQKFVNQAGIEAIINSVASKTTIPDEKWQKILEMQSYGGMDAMKANHTASMTKLNECYDRVVRVCEGVNQEESNQQAWDRVNSSLPPQASSVRDLKDAAERAKQDTAERIRAGKEIERDFEELSKHLRFMVGSKTTIESNVPPPASDQETDGTFQNLRRSYEELLKNKQSRDKQVEAMIALSKDDSVIRSELLRNPQMVNIDAFYVQAFAPVDNAWRSIEHTIAGQQSFIQSCSNGVSQFNASPNAKVCVGRQQALNEIDLGCSAFAKCKSTLDSESMCAEGTMNLCKQLEARLQTAREGLARSRNHPLAKPVPVTPSGYPYGQQQQQPSPYAPQQQQQQPSPYAPQQQQQPSPYGQHPSPYAPQQQQPSPSPYAPQPQPQQQSTNPMIQNYQKQIAEHQDFVQKMTAYIQSNPSQAGAYQSQINSSQQLIQSLTQQLQQMQGAPALPPKSAYGTTPGMPQPYGQQQSGYPWTCSSCRMPNQGNTVICMYCQARMA